MKSLEKWQIISFISRGIAMGFGIIQSFIILRILSVNDWGLAQLALSVGGALGIYQHLGLSSALNREIAASDKNTDIFKLFITAATARYLITFPLSIAIYLFAPKISQIYGFKEILIPLRIFSLIFFMQGIQALVNSVISGTKRFKELFIFQGVIALLSVMIYIPFVYHFKMIGFFYAMLIHEFLKTVILMTIAFKPFIHNIKLPTKTEFVSILKSLFLIGIPIYIVQIIVLNWEKAGTNLLGLVSNAHILGIFAFSLLYAKKLMNISDAVTDVNLPVFSEKYVHNLDDFKQVFYQNYNRIFTIIIFFAMSAIYWAAQLLFILVGNNKYNEALPLLTPMVFAYIFFSLLDITQSSVAIPAKMVKEMILGFLIMLVVTIGSYFIGKHFFEPIYAMAYSMAFGAFSGFVSFNYLLKRTLKFTFSNIDHYLILLQALVICYMGSLQNLYIKISAYVLFVVLFSWAIHLTGFIKKDDLFGIYNKLTLRFKR